MYRCMSDQELVCVVRGTMGNRVFGNVTFTPVFRFDRSQGRKGYHMCQVRIRASIFGLMPGKHGFHIHTYGDLRDAKGSSTGGHFTNPKGAERPHGWQFSKKRHWGDLGNVVSSKSKYAKMNRLDRMIKMKGIVGRSITIHASEDQGPVMQPSGNAGSRVAFCVIGYANPLI